MQKRSFLLLLAATLILVGAAAYTLMQGERGAGARADMGARGPAFPGLAAHLGDVAWMRVVHGAAPLDFALVGGHWAVVEKGNYPADPAAVRRLVLGLADLRLVEPKTERPALFGRLGLDDPRDNAGGGVASTLVSVQDRAGKTLAALIVGKRRPDLLGDGDDGLYVRRPGDNHTWLARGSLALPADMTDWLDRRIIDLPPSRIAAVTLTAAGADGATLTLRRDKPGGRFAVADPPADAHFKDDNALAAPAGALAGLALDDVKPAADFVFPPQDTATASFTTFDGLVVRLRLVARGGRGEWIALDATGKGRGPEAEAAAVDARVGHWVYQIRPERGKLLRTRLADLLVPAKGS